MSEQREPLLDLLPITPEELPDEVLAFLLGLRLVEVRDV